MSAIGFENFSVWMRFQERIAAVWCVEWKAVREVILNLGRE